MLTTTPVLSTIDEVALKIKRAKATIYSDLNRNPQSLPPVLRIPGSKKLLFVNVDLWILNLFENQNGEPMGGTPTARSTLTEPKVQKRKRGRPTNASKIKSAT